jgi:hypothetical protein
MPAIHASLNDDDFVAYHNLAKSKGMTAKELTESLVLSELRKLPNAVKTSEE